MVNVNRFLFLILIMGVFISISFISRTILLLTDFIQVDVGILSILKLYGVGLFYDFVASVYYIIPLVIYLAVIPNRLFNTKIHKLIFLSFFFIATYLLIFNAVSEWFFWEEFGKRFNFIAVDYLVYTHEVIHNILESYPVPLLVSIIFIVNSILFVLIVKKTSLFSRIFSSNQTFLQRAKIAVIFLLLPILFFNILDRQNLSEISDNQYNNELAKNGFYSLFSAFRNNILDYDKFYKTKATSTVMNHLDGLEHFNDKYLKVLTNEDTKELKYNVMLIMVESLSAEYMGVFGDDHNLTPHLDTLAQKSLFFNHFYATGTRTVRGMEAVTLSVPPTPGSSIVKRPDNHNMFSAGFIFREKGYENKFIYAGYGYFDNMNNFFSNNGFNVVDRSDFKEEEISFANVWGVCDGDLFNKALKESDKSYTENKPFFNFIMTTSNHRPYTYPEGKIDIPSHTGRDGGVKYSDYAIHDFLEKSKSKPWFKNTIFVIVADHNGGSAGKSDLPLWRYKIPLIVYAPNIIEPKVIHKLSSQVDTMPTLLAMMKWNYKSKFYGNDILDPKFKERAFIGTYQKLGLVKDKNLFILEPNKTIHQYNITNETLRNEEYKEIDTISPNDELDTITYYQSSSYFYKHHLDRWEKMNSSF
ncbi:sulfatase-like hydrolase/transferase [Sulfurovum sp.]|uniref:LTA synthase family protein n=1 Tax=Sulfurovum sp. TaxID=1969726 RepID=UPI002867D95B|nr:sulfatase-like hydrolase/transferase [Sulfurovum sp.]